MFILTIEGKESEGAYSVIDEEGDQILYLFEEEDDAIRFAMMLEESEHPTNTCARSRRSGYVKDLSNAQL